MYNAYRGGGSGRGNTPWRSWSRSDSSSARNSKGMPKRERSSSSSGSSRRTRPFRPGYDRGPVGYYGLLKNEKKFYDDGIDGTFATAGAIHVTMNDIAQGTSEKTRVGRQIFVHSLHIQGRVSLPAATNVSNAKDLVRIIVYIDHQANGATAAVTDILESAAYKQFRNLANRKRFSVISDQMLEFEPAPIAADAASSFQTTPTKKWYTLHKYFKKPVCIEYDGVTGDISEIKSNNFGMLLISANGNATHALNARLRFTD